jgi:HEPN domain-containing protein
MIQEEKIKYWTDLSDYDKDTAQDMLVAGRYLYVGFMCHQCIEKILKACFVKHKDDSPPYTHDLTYLAVKGEFYENFSAEQKTFIDMVEPLNIKTRYPDYKQTLAKSLTKERCQYIIEQTNNLQQWIKQNLL